jgi:hypothetical protein
MEQPEISTDTLIVPTRWQELDLFQFQYSIRKSKDSTTSVSTWIIPQGVVCLAKTKDVVLSSSSPSLQFAIVIVTLLVAIPVVASSCRVIYPLLPVNSHYLSSFRVGIFQQQKLCDFSAR